MRPTTLSLSMTPTRPQCALRLHYSGDELTDDSAGKRLLNDTHYEVGGKGATDKMSLPLSSWMTTVCLI